MTGKSTGVSIKRFSHVALAILRRVRLCSVFVFVVVDVILLLEVSVLVLLPSINSFDQLLVDHIEIVLFEPL